MEHTDVQNAVADPSPAAIQAPETIDLSTLSHQERQTWRETGKLPGEKDAKAESSAATKDKPNTADSAAAKESSDASDKDAKTASDSETDKQQEQGQKGKGAEARKAQLNEEIRGLIAKRDALKQEAEPKKDVKAEPSPAKTALAAPVKPDPNDPKFKNWEEYEVARDKYFEDVADYKAKKAVEEDRAARAQEESQKTLAAELVEVKKRYPDFEEKAVPALKKFFDDPEVPDFIKGTVGSSEVKHDLIYTLGDPETWAKIVETSKTDPRKALKAIFAAEDAIAAELSGKGKAAPADKTTPERDESGKFLSQKAPDKPVTKVPPPPSEAGGRGTDTEDEGMSAARAGLNTQTKSTWDRQYAERHK